MGKREPSPRQQQIVDAVVKPGSVAGAAAVLGIAVLTVDGALSTYQQRVCPRRTARDTEDA